MKQNQVLPGNKAIIFSKLGFNWTISITKIFVKSSTYKNYSSIQLTSESYKFFNVTFHPIRFNKFARSNLTIDRNDVRRVQFLFESKTLFGSVFRSNQKKETFDIQYTTITFKKTVDADRKSFNSKMYQSSSSSSWQNYFIWVVY